MLVLTDLAQERALSGVVLQQVSQHSGAGQVVDRDDFVAVRFKHLTESQTADTAKTIDSNFNSHSKILPRLLYNLASGVSALWYGTIVPYSYTICKRGVILLTQFFQKNYGYAGRGSIFQRSGGVNCTDYVHWR